VARRGRVRPDATNVRTILISVLIPLLSFILILISVLIIIRRALIPPRTLFSGGVTRPAPSADVSPSGMAVVPLTATGHFHEAVDRKELPLLCLWTRKASAVSGSKWQVFGASSLPFHCHSPASWASIMTDVSRHIAFRLAARGPRFVLLVPFVSLVSVVLLPEGGTHSTGRKGVRVRVRVRARVG